MHFHEMPDSMLQLQGRSLQIPKKEGVSKAKIFKGKHKACQTGISRRLGRFKTEKTFCGNGMDIFWNRTYIKIDACKRGNILLQIGQLTQAGIFPPMLQIFAQTFCTKQYLCLLHVALQHLATCVVIINTSNNTF